jgi:hypothetical protein
MSRKEQGRITRDDHERVAVYDWMLDLDMNPDFGAWAEEMEQV